MLQPRVITWSQYMRGRDVVYAAECTIEIRRNAQHTIEVGNAVLEAAARDGVDLSRVPDICHSGWRPRAINLALELTANAAHGSPHIDANAADLGDVPEDRRLARWALANSKKLYEAGVRGIERPQWTVVLDSAGKVIDAWLHIQTVSAKSGNFKFIPSSAPAKVASLPGELEMPRLT
jgi:hypothetical protein